MPALKIPEKRTLILWGAGGLSVLILFLCARFAFARLGYLRGEIERLKKEIEQGETLIGYSTTLDVKALSRELAEIERRLESPLRISNLVQELGRKADEHSVNIVSVEPSNAEGEGSISIGMALEGTFENLAKFLGELDNLNSAMVRVQGFDLRGQETGPGLAVSGSIEIYRHIPPPEEEEGKAEGPAEEPAEGPL
jgi:Tfp pilus assembly protein PilO